jgi:hypothetical protein
MTRRKFLSATAALLALALLPRAARAHHGWSWTDSGEFRLSGIVSEVRLGNPHGILMVQAGDELWTAEIGQPGRNARAGLADDLLRPGIEITLIGERSADPAELRMKAERVLLAGVLYDLYPNRS